MVVRFSHNSSAAWPNCGIQLSRTAAHNPAASGLMERFHLTLKVAVVCHADHQWTDALPQVLGIRATFKAGLQSSVAGPVYGESLRIPGLLRNPSADTVIPAHLSTQLRQHNTTLPAVRHIRVQGPPQLHARISPSVQHAGLWNPLTAALTRSFRERKNSCNSFCSKPVTVSADRAKPAYILNETDCGNNTFNPSASAAPATPSPPPVI
jgi:cleavage and polyadenylation specificity factor subunit 1